MARKIKSLTIRFTALWVKSRFYAALITIALIGGVSAFWAVPFAVPKPFSEQDSVPVLRQAVLVATGGVLAILTLWETRRKNEQEYMRQVHAERRSRYATAVEQLADEKAPIRLGGVYTLVKLVDEWLADEKTLPDEEERREEGQVIVNSLCAYIRSPFELASKTEELSENNAPENYDGGSQKFIKDQARFREEKELRLIILSEIKKRLNGGNITPEDDTEKLLKGPWSDFNYDFSNVRFFYSTDFTHSRFDAFSNFFRVEFTQGADFSGAKFTGDTDFSGAKFTGDTDFSGAKFTGDTDFSRAEFTKVTFSETEFTKVTFSETEFTQNANFSGVVFTGDTDFSGVVFTGDAKFPGVTFTGYAGFSGVVFTRNANFSGVVFTRNANFSGVVFTGYAGFSGVVFTRNANFSGVVFTGDTDFSGVVFTGDANFSRVKFTKVTFSETEFTQNANFSRVKFTKVTFSKVKFTRVDFSWAKFTGDTDFSEAKFTGDTDFSGAEFTGDANFSRVDFTKVTFSKVKFTREAIFYRAEFTQNANFSWATFTRVTFSGAEFTGEAIFYRAEFTQNANFSRVTFNHSPIFITTTRWNGTHEARFSYKVNPENYNFNVSSKSPYKIETEEQEHNGVQFIIPKGAILFDPEEPSEQEDNDGN